MIALLLIADAPVAMPGVPVLAHAVARGAILSAGDFEVQARAPAAATGALSVQEAEGLETVRALPAGALVRAADAVPPRLVRRGEPVTLVWSSAGLSIVAQGRALSAGASGDAVRVVAQPTGRTLDGIVVAAGTVRLP